MAANMEQGLERVVSQVDVTASDKAAVDRFHRVQMMRILSGDRSLGDNRNVIEQAFAERRLAGFDEGRLTARTESGRAGVGDGEVLPCPFCGSTRIGADHANNCMFCEDCSCLGAGARGTGGADLIAAWNKRALAAAPTPPATPAPDVERMREVCEYFAAYADAPLADQDEIEFRSPTHYFGMMRMGWFRRARAALSRELGK